MEFIARYFSILVDGMKQEMDIYGFKFSFFGVMIFVSVGVIIITAIRRIFE